MAKTFITSGTGASQTLDAIQNEKVPVYNTRAAAEADIANIEEGGIVATKDTGATEKVVDVVENSNMNPVTSNAVYDYIDSLSGVTQVGDWKLIRLGSSNLYLGFYYESGISYVANGYEVPMPNGYSYVQYYFGQAFQEGHISNVTGAVHQGNGRTYSVVVYLTGDSSTDYQVRACCLFQKNN